MALSPQLGDLTAHLTRRNPPASEDAIEAFIHRAGFQPPEDYLELMRQSDGAYGEGESLVFLCSLGEAIERTRETEGLPPKMIVFGSDGGDVQYLLDGRGNKAQIVSLSLHEEIGEARMLGPTLEKALAKLGKERHKELEQTLKRSQLPPLEPAAGETMGEVARLACTPGTAFMVSSMTFTADSAHVALAGNFGIQLWSVQGWRRAAELPHPGDDVSMASDLYLDIDAGTVLSVHDKAILIRKFRDRQTLYRHHQSVVSTHRCLTRDGRWLVRALPDRGLTVVDTRTGEERALAPDDGRISHGLHRAGDGIVSLRFDVDAQQRHLDLWSPGGAERVNSVALPRHTPTDSVADIGDGRVLLAGRRVVNLLNGAQEELTLPLPADAGTVNPCIAIPGASRIAASTHSSVTIVDLTDLSALATFGFDAGAAPSSMAASPDGRWLITEGIKLLSRRQFVVRVWRVG